jgi:hypothetical protein
VISDEGPKAFAMDDICQPGFWVAIYHVQVKSALTGTYHLAGYGDDFLIARINDQTVLDSGWYSPVTASEASAIFNPTWAPLKVTRFKNHDGSAYYRTVVGDSFFLTSGDSVTIDVLFGDCSLYGGLGACGFSLFLVQDGKDYPKDSTGFPIFPLLQMQPDTNVKRDGVYPPFSCNPSDALPRP